MIVLGIESSCDETAVAIVDSKAGVLSHVLASQYQAHKIYGGVVPEIAAREHLEHMMPLIIDALEKADLSLDKIDAFAATCGPGLIGGVMVGMLAAKSLALARDKPFIAINHLEAHALVVGLEHDVQYPFFLLLVSGGHTQFLYVEDVGKYKLIGKTLDDALGETFDKVAKMMDLPYPGGPLIEKLALAGDGKRFDFPRPMVGRAEPDFSFSGLKTAVRETIEKLKPLNEQDKADIAASFQETVARILKERTAKALSKLENTPKHFVVAGGVAANKALKGVLQDIAQSHFMTLCAPRLEYCTDNGVMIAYAGLKRLEKSLVSSLDFKARPRWPLSEL